MAASLSLSASAPETVMPVRIPSIVLMEPPDATPLDAQIRTSQLRLRGTTVPAAELERLGWLFVAKARASSDPGFNTVAGIIADTLEDGFGRHHEAWLLRGHVLQTRHRFVEAEDLGRRLVSARGAPADHALLGDALYDQGKIAEAAASYQQMVNLKPSLDSYARAANIRWIKGDLAGAIELQTLAVRSGGPGDAGALAWSLVRLGHWIWQQGNAADAGELAVRALQLVPDFQPALLLRGRLLLAAGLPLEALVPLARAAEILPLPESRWVHADALRAVGRSSEAAELEERLVREGVREDPRTVAVFLATHGREVDKALQLAKDELNERGDVVTQSAHALALAAAGRIEEAVTPARASLNEGTIDARLFLHAGRVAALGSQPEAAELLGKAAALARLLLPSELQLLEKSLLLLPKGSGPRANAHTNPHRKTS